MFTSKLNREPITTKSPFTNLTSSTIKNGNIVFESIVYAPVILNDSIKDLETKSPKNSEKQSNDSDCK